MSDSRPIRSGPVGVGIIGAGVISDEYIANLTRFPDTRVVAIGDLRPDAARAKAAEHGIGDAGKEESGRGEEHRLIDDAARG